LPPGIASHRLGLGVRVMKARLFAGLLSACIATQAFASAFSDLNAGITARNSEDWDEAIRRLTLALAAPDLLPAFKPVAYLDRAQAHQKKKEWGPALADYTAAIAADPQGLDAHILRARLYSQRQQRDPAIADYGTVIAMRPGLALGYAGRGGVYLAQQNYDSAIADFTAIIGLAPRETGGYLLRGQAYRRKGDYEKAIADEGQAIDLDSNDADGYFERGYSYQAKSDFRHALDDYDDGLKLRPGDFGARLNYGLAQWESGRPDDAAATFAQAVQTQPASAYAVLWLDISQFKTGKADETLRLNAAKLDLKTWPGPVVDLYLGTSTPDAALKASANDDPQIRQNQVCEADFYVGEWQLQHDAAALGKPLLAQAAGDCPVDFVERLAAATELKRLP
jgi:tetratricopeptide (TPR) repeat protein